MSALGISWIVAAVLTATGPLKEPVRPFESSAALAPQGRIDELVFDDLERFAILPSHLCSDEVFVRRAHLDVIGTLPTADEARAFLRDRSENKRRELIDRLLERDEFADYWAMKWSDLLRIKAEFPINLWPNAAQAYHRWVRTSIRENKPYDQFVRQLLTANGSNFRDPPVNFFRAMQNREPETIAQAVALTFLGTRAEKWPPDRLKNLAACFSQIGFKATGEWKEEIVSFDPSKAAAKESSITAPDGSAIQLASGRDPREAFADWLTAPGNPYFARNIVNRVWSWLLGRGIIQEPDDIRPDNPPSNPELLAYLEKELVRSKYDLKQIYRLILTSETYQLSSLPQSDRPEAAAHFASYPLRRLEAEVLIDAIDQVTGTTDRYSSMIPEPYTFIPENQRSIAIEDGSISSSFLELFGRPPRDTGLESERNNRSTAAQWLHMLNSTHVRRKVETGPYLRTIAQSTDRPRDVVDRLYLTFLSRYPTDQELKTITEHQQASSNKPSELLIDLAWALVNSSEFLYRH